MRNKFVVSNIFWERIFLNIEISTENMINVEFYLERYQETKQKDIRAIERLALPSDKYEAGKYSFCCNMSTMKGREFLNNGRWRIIAVDNDNEYVCCVAPEVAYQYEKYSRIFRYGKGKYAYTVSFETVTEKEAALWFVINSSFMVENNKWKKRKYIQEVSGYKEKIKRLFLVVVIVGIRCFYQILEHVFPKNGKHILFMSETKDYLWGNLKAIDDRIRERGLSDEFQIEYSLRKSVGGQESVISWIRLVYKIAKQDYIFVDDYVPVFGFLKLNDKTKLIQVWHAGEGFKAVGYCRFGKDGSPFPVGSCHKQYDFALTGSEKLIKVFSEVFGIEKEAFLPTGMPRLDGFLDEERILSFKKNFYIEYPKAVNKKLVLFAPTYRGTGQTDAYYNYSWIDLKRIYDFCDSEYVFIVKMHPFVKSKINIPEAYKERIWDLSEYPHINDLYYVTDILITDYSSNYFEYSLMKRPVLFFTPDRELYELSRGVHRSVKESAPGNVCDTFEEMMEVLYSKEYSIEKIYQFVEDNFMNYDGHAADKVIDNILMK